MNIISKALLSKFKIRILSIVMGAFAFFAVSSSVASAQQTIAEVARNISPSGLIQLGLFSGGEKDGYMILGWAKTDDGLTVFDRSMMPSRKIFEALETHVDAETLAPKSAEISFFISTGVLQVAINVENKKVVGTRISTQPTQGSQSVDVDLDVSKYSDLIFRSSAFILPFAMSNEIGNEVSFSWYNAIGNKIENVVIKADEKVDIETPGGAFSTIKFTVRGSASENDIFLSIEDEPKVVRIDVLNQPIQFLYMGGDNH